MPVFSAIVVHNSSKYLYTPNDLSILRPQKIASPVHITVHKSITCLVYICVTRAVTSNNAITVWSSSSLLELFVVLRLWLVYRIATELSVSINVFVFAWFCGGVKLQISKWVSCRWFVSYLNNTGWKFVGDATTTT